MIEIGPPVQLVKGHLIEGFIRQAQMTRHHHRRFVRPPFHQAQFEVGGNKRIKHLGNDQPGRQIRRQRRYLLRVHDGQADLGIDSQTVA